VITASKLKAVYEHGRLDFRAGAKFDKTTPLKVYTDLSVGERALVMMTWADGWHDESILQSLPGGMPA
jgi:hypothetical protein